MGIGCAGVAGVESLGCDGRAAAVTGRGAAGVSVPDDLGPGDDCTLDGLLINEE